MRRVRGALLLSMTTLLGGAGGFACGDDPAQTCEAGEIGCACAAGDGCGAGLHCYEGKCLPAPEPDTGVDATTMAPTTSGTGTGDSAQTSAEPTTDATTGEPGTVSECHELDQNVLQGAFMGFRDTIELTSEAAIGAVRIEVVARTTDASEVAITISGAQRTTAVYTAERCNDGVDVVATFDGASAQSIGQSCPNGEGVNGSVRPDGDFSEFVGRKAGGPWTLGIRDMLPNGAELVLERWCVHVDTVAGAPDTDPKKGEAEWLRPTALGDPARRIFAAWGHDLDRDVVVAFGGCYEMEPLQQFYCAGTPESRETTLEWDGAAWVDIDVPHPGANKTSWHMGAMAYDTVEKHMVLFGGFEVTGWDAPVDQTWTYDGSAWTQQSPPTSPSPRAGHTMVWDPVHMQAIVFGGFNQQGQPQLMNDVWAWQGATWSPLPSNGGPGPRYLHAATWHPGLARMVVIGGFTEIGFTGSNAEMWAYDSGTGDWQQYADAPVALVAGQIAHDARRDRLLVYSGGTSDVQEWDGSTWIGQTGPGWLPADRYAHGMLWLPTREVTFMYGGLYSAGDEDTWYYTPVP